ncbi:S41 family peptidase [Stackebrandtia nassauensis]|uniref:Peptidase S41 n=1 Tax=Stackebrandtia nassauensis (strain DSM 44728 / CIP 108903 / NRRL B-16338 / NBRC 102104 / LLR-40K-21) TaxID=446470 RepID=D3Q8X3_STANL|nr:S41 family peptidase [Stackebrandtia nassauensis]ADD40582.1 peptidase S41 [Stackebrandtia nassauensis DSM 44728]
MDNPEIINRTRELLVDHYVFPDVASRVVAVLTEAEAAGRYRDATEPATLGKIVTEDLQSINQDKHLRLKFHAEEQPDLPSEELMAAEARRDAQRGMHGIGRVERLEGNIAVVDVDRLHPTSISGEVFAAVMTLIADADGLVIDLRKCSGGHPGTVALVCSYLFGDEPVHLNGMYERHSDRTTQSWTLPFVPGKRYGPDKPICVLTSAVTFSGGEELAYDLQQLGRATIVGESTGGGAHPRVGFRLHPHLELTVPVARSIHPVTGTNWEGVGVAPDVAVPAEDALETATGLLRERLAEAAA